MMRLIIFIVLSFYLFRASAQEIERSLTIVGTAETNFKPLSDAKISLLEKGNVIKTIKTSSDGLFRFKLNMNSEYEIVVEKAEFLTKKISFNTTVPDDVINNWTLEFAISLIPACEGVSATVLNEPVDRVQFSSNKSDFISDKVYFENIQNRLQKLQQDVIQCQQEKFREAVDAALNLSNTGELEAAKEKYEEALKIYPDDKYALKKLEDINEKIGQGNFTDRKYNEAIKAADQLLASKNFEAAKAKYTEALNSKPQSNYAKDKIASIDNLINAKQLAEQEKLDKERNYNNLISRANVAYADKNFSLAKSLYQEALNVKPGAAFPQAKINELAPLVAKQQEQLDEKQANLKAYNEALAMAQIALQSNNLEVAKQHFNRAAMLNPNAPEPQQKISEIDKRIELQKQDESRALKDENERKIVAALDEGDMYFKQKNYDAAEVAYQRALQIDPKDTYARQRVDKIKSLKLAEKVEKQQALEKQHTETLSKADALLAAASYEQAIAVYKQALLQNPNDLTIKNKLTEAEQKLASEKSINAQNEAKKKEYDQYLAKANDLYNKKFYVNAKESYQKALSVFPDQSVPRNRIDEISKILEDQSSQKQFDELIKRADNLYSLKDYAQAKNTYQQALSIKPRETFVNSKILEIDNLIRQNEKLASEQKVRDDQFKIAVQDGDNMFALSKFIEAKAAYQSALNLKPTEAYPKAQVVKIDGLIAEQIRKEGETKLKEQQFGLYITQADQLFASMKYSEAKNMYQQALAVKPAEQYPKTQIAKIDQIASAKQLRNENEARAIEQEYNTAVSQADQLFSAKNYIEAKAIYQKALTVKPGVPYPSSQITKIDALIAGQLRKENEEKVREQQYNGAINQADKFLASEKLFEAKSMYEQALTYKPGEAYPMGQISRIDVQLIKIENERKTKEAFEQKYTDLIANADKAFGIKDYPSAKLAYTQALEMKPGEIYPRERINKIIEFEKIIAQQEASRKAETTITATAEKPAKTKKQLNELKFVNDSERDKYLNGLRKEYSEGVTLEVHKEEFKSTNRYVVIRGEEVREFRMVKFNWGGVEYSLNGIPITGQYFETQVKVREGEKYQKFEY